MKSLPLSLIRIACIALFLACTGTATLAQSDALQQAIGQFVQEQTRGMSGEVRYTLGLTDNRASLPGCTAYQVFLPAGGKLLGNTSVGVRCQSPTTWSTYVPLKISIIDRYLVTARALASGQSITTDDLNEQRGDLATLPAGTLTSRDQAIGKSPRFAIGAGQVLRSEQLSNAILIRQNQSVRVVARGNGFSASTEGKALNNAAEGQVVQVRTSSGNTVSGVVQTDGTVSVSAGN